MLSRFTPLLFVPLALLSACGTNNHGLESVYQPVVERNDYVFDVQTAGNRLAEGEGQRLAGWLGSMGLRYGDRIAVDEPSQNDAVRSEIATYADRYGLLVSDQAPVTVGEIRPGTARVVVTRTTASVPNCPDKSPAFQPDYSASTSANFGCATNSNLAAMIADPIDLVRGAPGSPLSDSATSAKAVNAYRRATPSGAGGTVKGDSAGGKQ
jgi:pilus assembly protein CpaD